MTTLKTSEVLINAKALIDAPEKWIQGDYVKERNGVECFCSLGALAKVMWPETEERDYNWRNVHAEILLCNVVGHKDTSFAMYNDQHNHTQVMEAFDKAIYNAQIQEATEQQPFA